VQGVAEAGPLAGAENAGRGAESRGAGRERDPVGQPAEPVPDRSTPGLAGTRRLRAVEAGGRVCLVEPVRARRRPGYVGGEAPPVVRAERLSEIEYPQIVIAAGHAAEVRSGVPQSAGDGYLLGGQFEEERPALVLRASKPTWEIA
jgi:hypothetical protein